MVWTRRAAVSPEPIVEEHLAASPDVVVALEGQNERFPSER